MSDTNIGTDDTGESENIQATQKLFTEAEVNDMMARLKGSLTKKLTKQWEDLGDPEELRKLKQQHEQQQVELQKKRGQFDEIIRDLAEKKDQEIRKRDEIIRNYTVDMPLVDTAAQLGAVNPNQVKQLLKPYVRMNETGEVEVLDDKGTVRYSDQGQPFGVKDLVKEFLDTNLHFRAAGPATTQSRSNIGSSPQKIDPKTLNMKDPQQRKMYKELRSGK